MTDSVRASLRGTEVRTITAQNIEQDYRISIALPASYGTKPAQFYPAIYLTDADFYFGMVTDLARIMYQCEELPEAIVVGIGYPVDEPLDNALQEIFLLRTRDLTPVDDGKKTANSRRQTGGAPAFLAFIQNELIPQIERDYRADPRRGCSRVTPTAAYSHSTRCFTSRLSLQATL